MVIAKKIKTGCLLALGSAILMVVPYADGETPSPDDKRDEQATTEKKTNAEELFFKKSVFPILQKRCFKCHSQAALKPKGELRLDSRAAMLKGGESGPAITPGKPDESLLIDAVRRESLEMPPKDELTAAQIGVLQRWVREGAHWPEGFVGDGKRGEGIHWSLRDLQRPDVPNPKTDDVWSRGPIDRFVLAKLKAAGLKPSTEADRRTLIRRLYFDLIGLPPSPEEVETFVRDPREDAYERLVDRLLASPHYGERWARHWLDVVRFGESNGFEYDEPRDNAWPYRNWVIRALNSDLSYDQFVRLQLAGDMILPDDPDGVMATSFLVAGAHNTTLPANDKMRMSMQQDEVEDLIATVSQTFLGLTVNCARCHDHKFDPITQQDYYRLAAALNGVNPKERAVRGTISESEKIASARMTSTLKQLVKNVDSIDDQMRRTIIEARKNNKRPVIEPPTPIALWEFETHLRDNRGNLDGRSHGGANLKQGAVVLDGKKAYVQTVSINKPIKEKTLEVWVRLENLTQRGGGVISIQSLDGRVFDAIVFGEREPGRWMAGSNSFARTRSFGGPIETEAVNHPVHFAITYSSDGRIIGYRNGKPYGRPYQSSGPTQFDAGKAVIVFGMRHAPAGTNKMLAGAIVRARIYDRALNPSEIAASAGVTSDFVSEKEIVANLSVSVHDHREKMIATMSQLRAQIKDFNAKRQRRIYTNVPKKPRIGRILLRGDVSQPGPIVSAGGIDAITKLNPDFGLKPDAPDGARRTKLADWLAHRENPLLARVFVNRLWHYHFGVGLVDTPNDFGVNGGKPSHPGLLDWLGSELRQGDWSWKEIHRKIVTSATYRQQSSFRTAAAKKDAGNRLLWRHSPQRLDAESLRDAMLLVSSRLDRQLAGRGYRDVRHYKFKGSNFYELLDEDGKGVGRRTVYRFMPRGGRNPLLDTFDCPDPSAAAPKRSVTTTPLQALALLNNSFVFRMADALAAGAKDRAGDSLAKQIDEIHRLLFARSARNEDVKIAQPFVAKHGLAAYCRVMLNSNEFLFVR